MSSMRAFKKEHRLQAFSVREIVAPFNKTILDISERYKIRGKKLRPGPFINALVLQFNRLPDETREAYAAQAIAELELFLAESDEERAMVIERFPGQLGNDLAPATRTDVAPKTESSKRGSKGA